jgi:outer membrane murein-binding lipoprotein Lpp
LRADAPGVPPPPPDGPPVSPAWLPGATQPLPPIGTDAWQGAPAPAGPGAAEPWEAILPPPEVRTHRTAVVVLAVLLGIVLAGASGLTWYLLKVNAAWQEHSQQWQALAEQHGADLARAQADLEATRTELAAVHDQLATAQERITQLADEKARLGDESAAQQQLVDYQARISTAAGQVATALATCIDGQEALITYLDSGQYDPTSLASYRKDVQSYCGNARDANTALQAELRK